MKTLVAWTPAGVKGVTVTGDDDHFAARLTLAMNTWTPEHDDLAEIITHLGDDLIEGLIKADNSHYTAIFDGPISAAEANHALTGQIQLVETTPPFSWLGTIPGAV